MAWGEPWIHQQEYSNVQLMLDEKKKVQIEIQEENKIRILIYR